MAAEAEVLDPAGKNAALKSIFDKYDNHLVVHGQKKFFLIKAKALEFLMLAVAIVGTGMVLLIVEALVPRTGSALQSLALLLAMAMGFIYYLLAIITIEVKKYWMAHRAVQAFTDPRKPIVYLRAFRTDDVVERLERPPILATRFGSLVQNSTSGSRAPPTL
jgi:hypothetical protein